MTDSASPAPTVTFYPGEPDPTKDTTITILPPILGIACNGQGVPLRLLTWEDEVDLITRAQGVRLPDGTRGPADLKARNTIVQGNLGLIHLQASRGRYPQEFFDDMIQEGILGLMKAIENFELGRGVRFSTYAMFWIRSKFNRCLDLNLKSIRWAPQGSGNLTQSLEGMAEQRHEDDSASGNEDIFEDRTVDIEGDLVNKQVAAVVQKAAEATRIKFFNGDKRIVLLLEKRILASEPLQIEKMGALIGMSKEGCRSLELRFLARMRDVLEAALE